jgi:cell division protein FtsW (lipid II flippase)
MGLIQKVKEKAGKIVPAVMGVGLMAGIGLSMVTGGAMAADGNTTAEVVKYYGLSMVQWILAVMAVLFAGAMIFLRDYRLAIMSIVMVVLVVIANFLGF